MPEAIVDLLDKTHIGWQRGFADTLPGKGLADAHFLEGVVDRVGVLLLLRVANDRLKCSGVTAQLPQRRSIRLEHQSLIKIYVTFQY